MSIYITYLTVYSGNLMPPFYIGSTSLARHENGYRGSVSSEKYKTIWKAELRDHPELFNTFVLSTHDTRLEALNKEELIHTKFKVHTNPLYINMATAHGKFGVLNGGGRPKGAPFSSSHRQSLSNAMSKYRKTVDHRAALSKSLKGRKPWNKGVKRSEEFRQKLRDSWKKRRETRASLLTS